VEELVAVVAGKSYPLKQVEVAGLVVTQDLAALEVTPMSWILGRTSTNVR
jgi:hypothetical protein